ncbi:MAG: hypothetical protein R6W06_14350 [Prochlorococcaceae cyanobacterium]
MVWATETIGCLRRWAPHELQPNPVSARLLALRRSRQFVGYVGEESTVEGAWFEEEKSSCSKRAILALLSCSSFKGFSLSSSRFSLSSDSIFSLSVSCSMVYMGRQLSVASKRRQGGEVQTHVDLAEQPLVMDREAAELEEVVIAVATPSQRRSPHGTPVLPRNVSVLSRVSCESLIVRAQRRAVREKAPT